MKYQVEIKEIYTTSVEIEADSPDHARQLAQQVIIEDELEATYSYTLDPSDWIVAKWENGSLSLCL